MGNNENMRRVRNKQEMDEKHMKMHDFSSQHDRHYLQDMEEKDWTKLQVRG